MPKRVHKFARFEGGLNENSDPRDVADNELTKSDNIVVDELGKLRLIGQDGSDIFTRTSASILPGYGVFTYSTDRDSAGDLNRTDWIAMVNEGDGNVDLRHTTASTSAFVYDAIDLGGDASSVQGSFYFADGILRASDGNHTANTGNTKWYGYVDKSLFQTTNEDTSGDLDGDGDSQAGTPAHYISEWTSVDSSLKKLSELGVSFDLDGVGTGPNSGTVGSSIKKIIVSYWKYEKGDWSGVYQIGVTPVYIGGQEGPMDIFTETINAAEEKISFQFFLTTGTSATISKNASHILGDNRIIGLNFWFRPFGDEDWHLLSDVDLLTGGKHHWKVYNSGTDTVYGIFYGTVAIAEPVKTSTPSTDHWSYTETTVTVTVDNDNSQYLAGRSGFVRVHGFLASPVYFPIPDFEDDTYSVPDTNKGEGIREIKVELLDEQFSILKEGTREYEVQDSGKAQPEDYSDVNDPRS